MTTETPLEHRLRSDLLARQAEASPAPADLAELVRRRHRGQRRAQLLTAVAAVAVVAVSAGAATLLQRPPAAEDADTAARPSLTIAPAITEWPTRGSLASDEAWLDAARRLDWEVPTELFGEIPDPPLQERHVAFAGDVDGSRVALVVGEDDDGAYGAAWFTGPADAAADEMAPTDLPRRITRNQPQALVLTDDPRARDGLLVVVAAPGSSADLTAAPVVAADGTETTGRTELPMRDGVVATTVEGAWWMGTELRTRQRQQSPYTVMPSVVTASTAGAPSPAPPGRLSEQLLVEETVADLLAQYDLTEEQARPTVLARGDAGGEAGRAVLLGLTFPSGATGTWLLSYEITEHGGSSSLGRLAHAPAGTALEDRLVAMPASAGYLALRAPDGAVRAEVLTEGGEVLGTVQLTDGSSVGEVPGGTFAPSTDGAARVRALDASGDVVAEGPIGRIVTE